MLGQKFSPLKKLDKKVKIIRRVDCEDSDCECLIKDCEEDISDTTEIPTGFFALYMGEERRRFVVPTCYLSHPLFKMLLEKAYEKFGFEQRSGLVVPCSVIAFQEVVSVVEGCNGKFDFGELVEEFV